MKSLIFLTASIGLLSTKSNTTTITVNYLKAEELFISQPAVTQAIHSLESQIGAPLFIRAKKGVTLICVTLNAFDDWEDHKKLYDYETGEEISIEQFATYKPEKDMKLAPRFSTRIRYYKIDFYDYNNELIMTFDEGYSIEYNTNLGKAYPMFLRESCPSGSWECRRELPIFHFS